MDLRPLFILLIMLCHVFVFGQDKEKIGFLTKKVQGAKDDTMKVNNLIGIAMEYASINPELAIDYCKKAVAVSQKLNFSKGEATALSFIGTMFKNMTQYDSAVFYQMKSFAYYSKLADKVGMSRIFNNIGIVHKEKGDYNLALKFYFKSITYLDEDKHAKHVARGLMNIGVVYRQMKLFNKSIDYYHKALLLDLKSKNTNGISRVYANIGNIFLETKNYDSAMFYYQKSHYLLDSMKETNVKALVEQNMANIYYLRKDLQRAKALYENSLNIFREAKDQASLARGLTSLGAVYMDLNDAKAALKACEEAIEIADQSESKVIKRDTYKSVSDNYFKQGKNKEAFNLLQRYINIKDSIYNDDNAKLMNEMDKKYQTEKKEKEIELLHKSENIKDLELKRQNIFIYSGLALTILIVVFSFFVYRNLRQNKRSNKLLMHQNKEIQEQKAIIEEKNKDILDSIRYAEGLQKTILPGDETIKNLLPDCFVLFQPKDIVSGDFYWMEEIKSANKIAFAAVDCTGHGVPGAIMSIVSHNLLTNIFREKKIFSPADALNELLYDLVDTLSRKGNQYTANDGMDITLCVWDKKTNIIEFAGAFNPLVLIRNGELKEFKVDKFSIGRHSSQNNSVFKLQSLQIEKGDTLYLSTDGYADQFGGTKSKKMMRRNFYQLLNKIVDRPMSEQKIMLSKYFSDWKSSHEQVDDVCVVGVRF